MTTYFIRQSPRLDKFFRARPSLRLRSKRLHSPFSVGELTIIICVTALALWKFSYFFQSYFKNGIKPSKTSTWRYAMFNLLGHASGHPLDVLLGFVMLPISRNSILGTHLRIPFDAALKFHRLAGWGMLVWALFHGSAYLGKIANNPSTTLWNDLFKLNVAPSKRVFKSYLTLFGALSLNIYFMLPGLILWIVDLTIRSQSWFNCNKTTIQSARLEANGLLRIDISSPTIQTYLPSQYVFLNISAVSKLEFHPYSVCSKPNSSTITLLMDPGKFGEGEWTKKTALLAKAGGLEGLGCKIEGPFGCLGFDLNRVDKVLCFVSGTGIVPALGIARHVLDSCVSLDGKCQVVVYWSTRVVGCGQISLIQELLRDSTNNFELHIYETSTTLNITPPSAQTITFASEAAPTTTTDVITISKNADHKHVSVITTSTFAPMQIHTGRMSVADVVSQHSLSDRTGIFLCGSRSLMKDVRTAVKGHGGGPRIHEESYEL
ncbi:hypothetical protein HK097_001530 [Rhizophlyctis rosea]|uniref:FAD-binding FR-type domain-containing protein n=1 Tax=Rhizophlyctis rosea TaxID=64517 RepID=A0AAD5SGW0_9FUNG|nr:hypothetical protein HK097_001530 [Rhizophlyctis rosea]